MVPKGSEWLVRSGSCSARTESKKATGASKQFWGMPTGVAEHTATCASQCGGAVKVATQCPAYMVVVYFTDVHAGELLMDSRCIRHDTRPSTATGTCQLPCLPSRARRADIPVNRGSVCRIPKRSSGAMSFNLTLISHRAGAERRVTPGAAMSSGSQRRTAIPGPTSVPPAKRPPQLGRTLSPSCGSGSPFRTAKKSGAALWQLRRRGLSAGRTRVTASNGSVRLADFHRGAARLTRVL